MKIRSQRYHRWFGLGQVVYSIFRNNKTAAHVNFGWLIFHNIARLLFGVLISSCVARYLGPEYFGELAYVSVMVVFFQSICTLGADGIVVRDISINLEIAPSILGSVFVLRIVAGVIGWFIAVTTIIIFKGINHPLFILTMIAGGSLVFQAADTIDLWFQSQSQSKRTVIAKLTANIFSGAIKIILIIHNAPLLAFVVMMVVEASVGAMCLCFAYRNFPLPFSWKFSAHVANQLIKESWPFMVSGLSIIIYTRIDQIMISSILTNRELGLYSAAFNLSSTWHFIPLTLATSLAPYVAREREKSQIVYLNTLSLIFKIFSGLALLYSTFTALFAELLVHALYGEAFITAASILRIHVFSNIFIALGTAQGIWLVNEGKGRYAIMRSICGALIACMANYIFLPRFGVLAAAYTSIISCACAFVFSNLFFAPTILRMQLWLPTKIP